MDKVSAELFCFTYGAMVSQLLRQHKDAAEVTVLLVVVLLLVMVMLLMMVMVDLVMLATMTIIMLRNVLPAPPAPPPAPPSAPPSQAPCLMQRRRN
jgi:hypothetical protein